MRTGDAPRGVPLRVLLPLQPRRLAALRKGVHDIDEGTERGNHDQPRESRPEREDRWGPPPSCLVLDVVAVLSAVAPRGAVAHALGAAIECAVCSPWPVPCGHASHPRTAPNLPFAPNFNTAPTPNRDLNSPIWSKTISIFLIHLMNL